ncbi:MAG: hypothetical protein ABI867_44840, partial [Kofleriaceae bacterium]
MAALELARHCVGALGIVEQARAAITSVPSGPVYPDDELTYKSFAHTLAGLPRVHEEVAIQLGPQLFRGAPVLDQVVPVAVAAEPTARLAQEAGVTVELLSVVHQVRVIAGSTRPLVMGALKRHTIVHLVESWQGRPMNFAFLKQVLIAEGIWYSVMTDRSIFTGKSLEATSESVDRQTRTTGALVDVGELDVDALAGLIAALPGSAPKIVEKLWKAAPDARHRILHLIADAKQLGTFLERVPRKQIGMLREMVTPYDARLGASLRNFTEGDGVGEGESLHERYLDQVDSQLDARKRSDGVERAIHTAQAYGWFFLDTLHDSATAGFHHDYADAYDKHEAGEITEHELRSRTAKLLGKAAVITVASAVTGGAAGEFSQGAAAGLGAGRSAAQIIGGAVGGAVSGVAGHAAGDIYGQAVGLKPGFDPLESYLQAGVMGGITGTVMGGVSVAAGKYLGPGGMGTRPIDVAANRFPRIAHVLEKIRGAGFKSSSTIRMKVAELLELLGSGFGGPGGPNAFAYAGGDVRTLPLDTEVSVRIRPLRPFGQPMQMSSNGNGSESDAEPQVAIESVTTESRAKSPESARDLPPDEWMQQLEKQLAANELEEFVHTRGNWPAPAGMKEAFKGDISAARQAILDAQAKTTPKPATNRITDPVDGLYDGVDDAFKAVMTDAGELTLYDQEEYVVGKIILTTHAKLPNGKTGWIQRVYDPITKSLEMSNVFLDDLPTRVRTPGTQLDSQGTPTQAYLTMRQMKSVGISYGTLKTVKMSTIQNIRSIIELNAALKAGVPIDTAVLDTYSITYAKTAL